MRIIKESFLDIINIVMLRFKLLFSNKILFVTIGLFFLIATLTINTFFIEAKDKSTIPIGIVDLDNSSHSRLMIDNLKNNRLIKINVYDSYANDNFEWNSRKKELINNVEKNEINALFIIKKGFGKNIENRRFEKIIEDYYCSNQKYAQIISDIVLSSILDDVCYNYSIEKYYSLQDRLNKIYTKEQYKKKIIKLYENQEESIGFDFDVVNINNSKSVNDNANIELIYREVIVGVIALIILIIVLLAGSLIIDDYKNNIILRIDTTNMTKEVRLLGDVVSICTISGLFALLLGVMLVNKMGIIGLEGNIKFLLIILLFTFTIGMVYVFYTRIIKDIRFYQLVGSMTILFLGISGAIYILGFYFENSIVRLFKNMPLGLLINSFKNITLNISCKDNIITYVSMAIIMYICINIIVKVLPIVERYGDNN